MAPVNYAAVDGMTYADEIGRDEPRLLVAALLFARGLDDLGATVVEIGAADPPARLNILAGDGTRLLATTWGETLSVLDLDTGVVLASEPYDYDPRWRDIPDRHLVEVNAHGIHLMPLERR